VSSWLVLKPIPVGGGKKIEQGSVVEADNWRNRRTLESGRYIQRIELTQPAPNATVESKPVKKAGRPPKVVVEEG